MDLLRAKQLSQNSLATSRSGRPGLSSISMQGFFVIQFRSSCRRSRMQFTSSAESCCPQPLKRLIFVPRVLFRSCGAVLLSLPHHISLIKIPQALASLPPMPKGFSLLIWDLNLPRRKNFVNSGEFAKHCKPEFMKHVLPRFDKPTAPHFEPFVSTDLISARESSSTVENDDREIDDSAVDCSDSVVYSLQKTQLSWCQNSTMITSSLAIERLSTISSRSSSIRLALISIFVKFFCRFSRPIIESSFA